MEPLEFKGKLELSELQSADGFFLELFDWLLSRSFPLVCFGHPSHRFLVGLAAEQICPTELSSFQLGRPGRALGRSYPRWIGALAYPNQNLSRNENRQAHRIYRLRSGVVWDGTNRILEFFGEKSSDLQEVRELCRRLSQAKSCRSAGGIEQSFELTELGSKKDYLENIEQILRWIRSGRFYQLNLLRYFRIFQDIPAEEWFRRFLKHSGPFGFLLWDNQQSIVSFSPERFVRIEIDPQGHKVIQTEPIKGTSARYEDPARDRESALALTQSSKDRAELSMIVDLMRNDLNRICSSGSVALVDSGSLKSFQHVHHLVAKVEGRLNENLTFERFVDSVCPAGSITGAPKIEVQQAILELEQRSRGFFMGNAFWMADDGTLDSSVLIRTATKIGSQPFEYAAGSGIVVSSRPEAELAEVYHKCRPLTDP